MLKDNYDWQRFWCPPDSQIYRTPEGYLEDPGLLNKDAVTFDSLIDVPCLVLLGEPGMGKSRTMEAERTAIEAKIRAEGGQTLWFDLRSYSSEERLVSKIFQNDNFVQWRDGTGQLHLFLDSLDEGLLRIETLSSVLAEELGKCDARRLAVRIACRSAEWQSLLESELRNHWGSELVKLFEILPLRRQDVAAAVEAEGMDAEPFLKEVRLREAGPLAAKPVTLRHLLRIRQEEGKLPQTQWQLYEQGCKWLCDEVNQSYTETRLRESFTAEQRMKVAGRIAAFTLFGKRSTVWIGNDLAQASKEDLTFSELRGGYEEVDGSKFSVAHFEIREALNTGLFSLRGSQRLGWAHQTYAEFLAAWYLTQHELTTTQLMSLLVHPGDRAGKLVPQLREVAAWFASVNQEVRRRIARLEPDVLLQSDIGPIPDSEKAELVAELLALYDEERDYLRDWSIFQRLHKLNHPGLGAQLRAYISDSNKKVIVRHVAIEIAEACQLSELQSDLVEVVLDPSDVMDLRSAAAGAVISVADDKTKLRLGPLAKNNSDIQDRLKGWALQALWPQLMTTSELFPLLTAPATGYAGSYTNFLGSDFLNCVPPADLPIALAWVERQEGHHLDYYLQRIVDQIMLTAWEHLEEPSVLEAFARASYARLRRYTPIVAERFEGWERGEQSPAKQFEAMLTEDVSKRRSLIEELISLLTEPNDLVHSIPHITRVVRQGDLEWMIERVHTSAAEDLKVRWAKLIRTSYTPYNPDELNLVIEGCRGCLELAREIVWDVQPVVLDSDVAREMRSNHERLHRKEEPDEKPAIDPPIADRIQVLLEECEAGDWDAWWRLNYFIKFESDGTTTIWDSDSDLKSMPGWANADSSTRTRIVRAAKGYIQARDDARDEWLGKNIIYHAANAGYRALRLVREEDPEYFAVLGPQIWERWASIITVFPLSHREVDSLETETENYLMSQAYANAPQEVIAALRVMIENRNDSDGFFEMPAKIKSCIDERLGSAILEDATADRFKPGTFRSLMSEAIEHDVPGAREFAESLLSLPLPTDEISREKALNVLGILLERCLQRSWPSIWAAIQSDVAFCCEAMERNASFHRPEKTYRWEHHLNDQQLADLFILAVNRFPMTEDQPLVGFHCMSSPEFVARWRDGLLNHLKSRGTSEACQNIERIQTALPQLQWLKWALIDAQDLARRNNWTPVEIPYLLDLISSSQKRLVQNGQELLDVLKESLARFQVKLHDETPAVRDLWNEPRGKDHEGNRCVVYTPKEEEALSDVLKRHLDSDVRDRGVIVNREVMIRRSTGQSDGERTDIHVDAVSKKPRQGEPYQVVKVIIEVKGCWNADVKGAMETQLAQRYLKDKSARHGLYIVAWFSCIQWHDTDSRKQANSDMSLAQATQFFDSQARLLSIDGIKIESVTIDASLR